MLKRRISNWLRSAAVGACVGPLAAGLLSVVMGPRFLHDLWTSPLVAVLVTAAAGAAIQALVYGLLSAKNPDLPLPKHTLAILAVAFTGILSILGRKTNSEETRDFASGLAFVGVTVLSSSSVLNAWRAREAQRELSSSQSRVRELESQLNPHFFFNTLNTISALVKERPDQAQETIRDLADLFRHTMDTAGQEWVPLRQELDFARRYLSIEKARFGDRLQFELPDDTTGRQIPGLTLQPVIENAVRHGIARRMDGGVIRVVLDGSEIRVFNPVDASDQPRAEQFFREGHSLSMVRERLALLTEGRGQVHVRIDGEYVGVTLSGCVR